MATTTNYGWTTPNDTDLVKDGAAAIRTLGSSIDTTTKALNPSTTLGDIEYRSATANTNTRLGIGSNGQYLTITGGVPAWGGISAGGMTLLSTTTLSGATVTISSIDQTYKDLLIIVSGVTNATADGIIRIAPNGSTTISYASQLNEGQMTTAFEGTHWKVTNNPAGVRTNADNSFAITINNYASTSATKPAQHYGGYQGTYLGTPYYSAAAALGFINTTSAISSLVFSNSGGNLSTGTVLLYGVK